MNRSAARYQARTLATGCLLAIAIAGCGDSSAGSAPTDDPLAVSCTYFIHAYNEEQMILTAKWMNPGNPPPTYNTVTRQSQLQTFCAKAGNANARLKDITREELGGVIP